jgi:hypothetical protein
MRFLIPDTEYWETGDVTEGFAEGIFADAKAELDPSVNVEDIDAGPSASIPAVVLHIMSAAADGLAIFAGPMLIEEGFKWWKEKFGKTVALLRERSLKFSIDKTSAVLVAVGETKQNAADDDELEIVSVTRHWFNLNGARSDHQDFDPTEPDPWLTDPHSEAVKQFNVRYVILLRWGAKGYTAIVESDGSVSSVYPL